MAGPPWFHHSFNQIESELLELTGDEANHILGARRMRPGDELVLCNGQGKLAHCTLDAADRRARQLRLRVSLVAQLEPPARQLILASALPKGDRLGTMLDMCCQLGMTRFQPLTFEHSVTRWSDKLRSRCERVLIEACKQSNNPWVPSIDASMAYPDILSQRSGEDSLTLLSDQFGDSLQSIAQPVRSAKSLRLLVGPEGGLSAAEIDLARERAVPAVRLAESILRIETAAVAGIAALSALS